MFAKQYKEVRKGVYGILTRSITTNKVQAATGFIIADNILATVAHVIPEGVGFIYVSNSFDAKCKMTSATLIAKDDLLDVALLKIDSSTTSSKILSIETDIIPAGKSVGTIGFYFPEFFMSTDGSIGVISSAQFRGFYISSLLKIEGKYDNYIADTFAYKGASGAPAFLPNGKVIGMQRQSITQEIPYTMSNEDILMSSPVAFSFWITSPQIITFAESNGIKVKR